MKLNHSAFVDALQKAGSRNSVLDRERLKRAHDAIAELADGAHCMTPVQNAILAKANRRNSAADMSKIEECHKSLVSLGAECPGMEKKKETGEGWPKVKA